METHAGGGWTGSSWNLEQQYPKNLRRKKRADLHHIGVRLFRASGFSPAHKRLDKFIEYEQRTAKDQSDPMQLIPVNEL